MLTNEERETIIGFNATREAVSVFTAQPDVWRRLDKIEGFKLVRTEKLDGKVCGKEFECPKSFVKFTRRGVTVVSPRKTTEKQREAARLAAQKGRLSQKSLPAGRNLATSSSPKVNMDDGGLLFP